MGCQCNKKEQIEDEEIEEGYPYYLDEEPITNKQKEDFQIPNEEIQKNAETLDNQEQKQQEKGEEGHENDEEYLEKLIEEKNAKYADYPDLMVELINKIRENPTAYADVIEDSIKYIIEEPDKKDETCFKKRKKCFS